MQSPTAEELYYLLMIVYLGDKKMRQANLTSYSRRQPCLPLRCTYHTEIWMISDPEGCYLLYYLCWYHCLLNHLEHSCIYTLLLRVITSGRVLTLQGTILQYSNILALLRYDMKYAVFREMLGVKRIFNTLSSHSDKDEIRNPSV